MDGDDDLCLSIYYACVRFSSQVVDAPDTEAVRIFVEFEKISFAIKGTTDKSSYIIQVFIVMVDVT